MANKKRAVRQRCNALSPASRFTIYISVLAAGICLGIFSEYFNMNPHIFSSQKWFSNSVWDIEQLISGKALWLFIGVCLSVCSCNPLESALHGLLFFGGSSISRWLYRYYSDGSYPQQYGRILLVLLLVIPALSFVFWYAKGKGLIPFILSSFLLSLFINHAFSYGMIFVRVISPCNVLFLFAAILILHQTWKRSLFSAFAAGFLAVALTVIQKL